MSGQHHVSGARLVELGVPWFVVAEREPLPCRVGPDVFFTAGCEGDAVLLCVRCRYRAECAAYGLEHVELAGVWGGLSEKERQALRRRSAA